MYQNKSKIRINKKYQEQMEKEEDKKYQDQLKEQDEKNKRQNIFASKFLKFSFFGFLLYGMYLLVNELFVLLTKGSFLENIEMKALLTLGLIVIVYVIYKIRKVVYSLLGKSYGEFDILKDTKKWSV